MKYTIYPKEFETPIERPLYISDANSYEVKLFFPEDVKGTLTIASYRPGTVNPKLATSEINGKEACCTLQKEQYDIPGETRFECIVSDVNGEILTTSSFVATVQNGGLNGEVASNDLTDLESLITLATKQVEECEKSKSEVQAIADDAQKTADDFEGKIEDAVDDALAKAKESGDFKGEKGDDGYTPKKGTDYWTDSDIAEIKAHVDEAILGGAW